MVCKTLAVAEEEDTIKLHTLLADLEVLES
jgi:hypothetical protein